jgi:biopolymer transport protein ExbD
MAQRSTKLRTPLAIIAAVVCVAMVALVTMSEAPRLRRVKVPVAARDAMCGQAEREIVRVKSDALEWNGKPVSKAELQTGLVTRLRDRADRVAYVEGTTGTSFGEVAQTIALLRAMNVQVVMLTPSVTQHDCSQASDTAKAPSARPEAKELEPVPWWKFW